MSGALPDATGFDKYLNHANVVNAYMRSLTKICSFFGGTDVSVPYGRRRECVFLFEMVAGVVDHYKIHKEL